MSSSFAVEVNNIKREYTTRDFFGRVKSVNTALKGISFNIKEGELFGVIGPNGAGKTTTIKILSTLLTQTSGEAFVLGLDVRKEIYEIRKRIGIVFGGERGLYNRVTAVENLRYFAGLYGVSSTVSKQRIPELIEMVGLKGRENEKVEKYSRGMKQRLHIAKALINDPEMVFLDEPTIGLDPAGSRDIRDMIRDMKKEGKTILLTTHYMFEADELCQRIAVISKGNIVALDKPSELKKQVKDVTLVELQVYGATEDFLNRIKGMEGVSKVYSDLEGERQMIRIQTPIGGELIPEIRKLSEDFRTKIIETNVREPTLEDAYLRMVEE